MFRKLTIVGSTMIICLSTTGCGPSRLVQCNQLIATINKGNALVNWETSYNAVTTNKLGGQLETIAQEAKVLEFRDENLQQFQKDFTQVFEELSLTFIEMSLALKTTIQVEASLEGIKKFNQAKEQLKQAGKQANKVAANEDMLVDKLVSYCQDK